MPTTNPQVRLLDFSELMDYASSQTGMPTAEIMTWINSEAQRLHYNGSLTWDEAKAQAMASWLNQQGFEVNYNGAGQWSGSFYQNVAQVETPSFINSNAATINRGTLRQMYGNIKEFDGTHHFMQLTKFPASGGLGTKAMYVLGSAAHALGAVSTGIGLGKMFDSALYNSNPDFFDSIGMSSLNPETWNSITNGDDSPFAGLFNFILGLDPDTGTAQGYIDENALAYYAYYMAQNGVFDVPITSEATLNDTSMLRYSNIPQPVLFRENSKTFSYVYSRSSGGVPIEIAKNLRLIRNENDVTDDYYFVTFNNTSQGPYYYFYFIEKNPQSFSNYSLKYTIDIYYANGTFKQTRQFDDTFTSFNDGSIKTMATYHFTSRDNDYIEPNYNITVADIGNNNYRNPYIADIWYILKNGTISTGGIDGISNQPNATLPDISSWNDIPSTLASLQQQYPDLWNNAMTWNNDDPTSDTSGNVTTYVPVPFPITQNMTDTQPVSGDQTQTSLNIDTLPATALDTLIKMIQATQTQTATDTQTPPENPTDTGTGDSPVPIPPTGSASALWAVYHPTQSEVNSFGAWLWSNNFVDQLLKVFQNPMDAIISLHKVFITPVDAGTTTIHAGYLDSGVSSDYITQQYVYKDCGYVDCSEEFGNVFDYIGTNISLYLPFIGIVPLNVDEVMRSTIHVTYGCDLFTGAILAQVEVKRDGNTVVMYQYGGDGGVQYPVSGSRSSGFLTGLAATIGAAASVMTGGASLPAIGAAFGGSVMSAQKQVQHSGGFSGNSGAMGGKIPYLIIERPQTKVAKTFPRLAGYPTNYSCKLGDCSNHVVVSHVHVEGINATDTELEQIETLLKDGVLV